MVFRRHQWYQKVPFLVGGQTPENFLWRVDEIVHVPFETKMLPGFIAGQVGIYFLDYFQMQSDCIKNEVQILLEMWLESDFQNVVQEV